VFGRDEGGGGFEFAQHHVDTLCAAPPCHFRYSLDGSRKRAVLLFACRRVTRWANMMADPNDFNNTPSPDNVMTLDLCVSDKNKELLLANPAFIPYLISGLVLGVDHPRADLKDDIKLWNQTMHAECFAQLALFSPGRDAMRSDPSVAEALQTVATEGLCAESRDFAKAALMAMSDEELHRRTEGQKHVMLSCECALYYTRNCTASDVSVWCNLVEQIGYVSQSLIL
jgi:hypothetical protein